MAQERFADVVERFTSGFNGATAAVSPEIAKQWQDELDRNVRRMTNLARAVDGAGAAAPGRRRGRRVYKRNKSRLYRYASSRHASHAGALRAEPRDQPALHLRPACRAAPSSST